MKNTFRLGLSMFSRKKVRTAVIKETEQKLVKGKMSSWELISQKEGRRR